MTKKYKEDLRKAMNCAEKGKAYHWPTVAEILADEVKRLQSRPNDAKAMIAEMDKIQEEYPLDHIFTDDARYTWPERWKKLREVCKQSEGSE